MELPMVPPPITVNTGEEDFANRIKEEFFALVLEFLGYDDHKAAHFADREDRILAMYGSDEIELRITDTEISMLIARDIPVASVVYRRTRGNYVYVFYAHYLNEEVIKRARFHYPEGCEPEEES